MSLYAPWRIEVTEDHTGVMVWLRYFGSDALVESGYGQNLRYAVADLRERMRMYIGAPIPSWLQRAHRASVGPWK